MNIPESNTQKLKITALFQIYVSALLLKGNLDAINNLDTFN